MSYKFVFSSPYANRLSGKLLSTIRQTNNVLRCGVKLANEQLSATLYGPTAIEMVKELDLSEKTCLVTGANSGLGLEMSRCLTAQGATVLMACRNKYAAEQVARAHFTGNTAVANSPKFYEVNLASLRSVAECTDSLLKNEKQIDTVILNAAVFGIPWNLTEDQLETTFQVNYLSQLYLLWKIDSILAPNVRVVFVSSESHRNVRWSLHNRLMPTESMISLPRHEYTSIRAYNVSKLCGLLAMHHLAYMWSKSPRQVFCAHPGTFVKTRLCRNWWPYEVLYTMMIPFTKNIRQAASTPLYCATSPDLEHVSGCYYKDLKRCDESEIASDLHLAFRINDIAREMIASRSSALTTEKVEEKTLSRAPQQKDAVHEGLTPEYSA